MSVNEAIRRVAALPQGALVAIDGLPVSGKSTLADRIIRELGFAGIFLDDFVLPESQWPAERAAAVPFPFFRWEEFAGAVWSVANTGRASFRGFDWSTMSVARDAQTIQNHRGVVVEGVSSLHPDLNPLYSLRIFVDSDRSSVMDASITRGIGHLEAEWRNWFLPSTDLYMATDPAARADLIVPGRGSPAIG